LESFYSEVGRYPNISTTMNISGQCLVGGSTANFAPCTSSGTIYFVVPPNPANCTGYLYGTNYAFVGTAAGDNYNIYFCLEKDTGGYPAGNRYATPVGIR
ncbi:MAG: hypothetical protein N2259_01545, partial [Patescibacteria group bacterium]|nr:hypothetical protein [Patescibacteria group bacterium]